jgi:hypothetical protein
VASLLDPPTRASVEARITRLRPDSARQWGRMTPHQAICHMSDVFRMSLNEREVAAAPTAFRPVVRLVALWLPLRWPAGRIKTLPEVEQGAGGTPPGEFERDRAELLALITRFCAATPAERSSTHPILGPMSTTAWGRWGYRHLDHHLRQFSV